MARSAVIWIIGLLMLAGLAWACIDRHVPQIESDIAERAGQALSQADVPQARVARVDGLDVTLTGDVTDQDLQLQAVNAVAGVRGVRAVHAEFASAQESPQNVASRRHVFNATYADGELTLTGSVRDNATRASMVGFARRVFAGKRVADRLSVVASTPQSWSTIGRASLEQLAKFSHGTLELRDNALTLSGVVTSHEVMEDAQSAIVERLDAKYTTSFAIQVTPAGQTLAQNCQLEINRLLLGNSIQFAIGSDVISIDSLPVLDNLVTALRDCTGLAIEVQGHTDSYGNARNNQRLSEMRAQSVIRYLRDEGLDTARITARGYGAAQPIADNATAQGRAKNRRIEIITLEN